MNPMYAALIAILLLPGCLLMPPDQAFPGDDDDATTDDDDVTGDDDDAVDDDDTPPPDLPNCVEDTSLPGNLDGDGDGWPVEAVGDGGGSVPCDCDDENPYVFPGATEVFDLRIQDCEAEKEVVKNFVAPLNPIVGGVVSPVDTSFFGGGFSWGALETDDCCEDLCVRGGAWVHVVRDPAALLGTDDELVQGTIGPFAPGGSVECGHDVTGDGVDDVVINAWGAEIGAEKGLFVFSGAALPQSDFSLSASDANATWNYGATIPGGPQAGHCLGVGELAASSNQTASEILVGIDDLTSSGFAVLRVNGGADSGGTSGTFAVEQLDAWTFPVVQSPEQVRCFVVDDLDGGGLDEMVFQTLGSEATLRFTEAGGLGSQDPGDILLPHRISSAVTLDTDGDGYSELLLGGADLEDEGQSGAGLAVLIRGGLSLKEWREVVTTDGALYNTLFSEVIADGRAEAGLGSSVCWVGDVDEDGKDDFYVTAPSRSNGPIGEARLYLGRDWEEWSDSRANGRLERGSEDTLFESQEPGIGFGRMTRCSPLDAPRAPYLFVGSPLSEDTSGALWWWLNLEGIDDPTELD